MPRDLPETMPRHGSPYDRGSADSYYRRGRQPHYYPSGTYTPPRVERHQMTEFQIAEYDRGYDDNERDFHWKEWE